MTDSMTASDHDPRAPSIALRVCRRAALRGLGSLAAIALATGVRQTTAQEASPEAEHELPEGVSFALLAQAVADELPPPPANVGVFRVTIAPGASDAIEAGPVVELVFLEAGTLTVRFAGPATTMRAGVAGTPVPQEDTAFAPGDSFLIPAGASFSVQNAGTEPALLLAVAVFPPEAEGTPSAGTPTAEEEMATGITVQPLALGVASDLPTGPTVLGLGRITLEPGASAPPEEPHPGPELIVVEAGTLGVTLTGGEARVLRGVGTGTPRDEPGPGETAMVGSEIALDPGDALFAHTGSTETASNLGADPTEALVVFLAPAGEGHADG